MNCPGVKRASYRRGILEKVTEDSLWGGGLASDKSQPGFSSCGEQGSRKKMQLEVRSLPAWLLSLNEQAAKSSAKKRGEGVCRTDD